MINKIFFLEMTTTLSITIMSMLKTFYGSTMRLRLSAPIITFHVKNLEGEGKTAKTKF